LSLSGSPFAADLPPLPQDVDLRLVLARRARVTATITTLGGNRVRTLADDTRLLAGPHAWSWDGRDDEGAFVADGLYEVRVRAANGLGVARETRQLRKGLPQIYPANPEAIVIVVDPGHGGRFTGACYKRLCEKDFNLDISLKLRALLLSAGVTVVMTRTTDTAVDEPESDVNGDGLSNGYDDLAARNDIANLARADVNIHNHNNAFGCRCTRGSEIFTNFKQPWSPAGIALANILSREQITALEQFRDETYFPIDRGVTNGNYYYMSPYSLKCPVAKGGQVDCKPPYQPRPSLVPSVLTESLFVNNDIEFALLKREDVRLALAASFYLAMAEYVNERALGIGFMAVTRPPSAVHVGADAPFTIRVTNRGNVPTSGWKLQLHSVPHVPVYDGSPQIGARMGSVAVPDGLQPGQSVNLTVDATAPSTAGRWWVKADVRLPDATYASSTGVVALQMPLTTTE
jgi:N-acetylmuramoyl-L-alanine amidase